MKIANIVINKLLKFLIILVRYVSLRMFSFLIFILNFLFYVNSKCEPSARGDASRNTGSKKHLTIPCFFYV